MIVLISPLSIAIPTAVKRGATMAIERKGFIPKSSKSIKPITLPSIRKSPCAILRTLETPNVSVRPKAIIE
jgi:hypothetical protein